MAKSDLSKYVKIPSDASRDMPFSASGSMTQLKNNGFLAGKSYLTIIDWREYDERKPQETFEARNLVTVVASVKRGTSC